MNDLAIYIHWPFCQSKCPYCDFNSHVHSSIDQEAWLDAYLKQINEYANIIKNHNITSVFFGGGTPSLMPVHTVAKIIDKLLTINSFHNSIEITLEANPTSVESNKFIGFKAAGINRVSIGIQSFNEVDLKFLGRAHSKTEAIDALKIANKVFDNYSFDLIYARPNQTVNAWQQEMLEAVQYAKNHLSLYQLSIEKGTQFYQLYQKKKFTIPNQDLAADLYILTNDFMMEHGLEAYEISNYATIPSFQSQHNLSYWRYNQYLGIGPGAHSRIFIEEKPHAMVMLHDPQIWLKNISKKKSPVQQKTLLTPQEILYEYMIMGLRINEGVNLTKLKRLLGHPVNNVLNAKALHDLCLKNYIIHDQYTIALTTQGRLLLNSIVEQIIN